MSLAQGDSCSFPLFRIIVIVKRTGEFVDNIVIGVVVCKTGVRKNRICPFIEYKTSCVKTSLRESSRIKST